MATVFSILKKRPVSNVKTSTEAFNESTSAARLRALNTINGSWKREPSTDDTTRHPQTTYSIRDDHTKIVGGEINLIRAVTDSAGNVIKDIVAELAEIETRKQYLLLQKTAHEEMLAVANKYVDTLTVTVSRR